MERSTIMRVSVRWFLAAVVCGVALSVASGARAEEKEKKAASVTFNIEGMT